MSREPLDARGHAEQLTRGIDPNALGHDAVGADIARATDSPAPRQLDAGCIRSSYEAIAEAGEHVDDADDAVLVSLRSGARAAADAARVADEIGAGPGDALRAAARAWTPHAVEGESGAWRAGLRAFSEVCSTAEEADDRLVVRAIAAAADALEADETGTGRAARMFSQELARRTATGARLAAAWDEAAGTIRTQAPDPVFHVVVDAVAGVLRQRGARDGRTAAL
ncbi:hypothetical protein [Brachybacterium sp. FME24]|uniref:hypothetical protein n=1 Tax=Brachybacterium sp. FME24 TaxID=2742605 RepID=UPI00186675F3|nr:hypothetical protein [Brachybacterium sp. FME24]